MADTKTDASPDDLAPQQALLRAKEMLERIELRRTAVLDARRDAIEQTRALVTSDAVRRAAGGDLEQKLNEIANNIDARLQKVDEDRKRLATSLKAARGSLQTPAKRRAASSDKPASKDAGDSEPKGPRDRKG